MIKKALKIIASVLILLLLLVVVASRFSSKDLKKNKNSNLFSEGLPAGAQVSGTGNWDGLPAQLPPEVLPEFVRLDGLKWMQAPDGSRKVEFSFTSANSAGTALLMYGNVLTARGWIVSVSGNGVEAIKQNKKLNYQFQDKGGSSLVSGYYEEGVK